MRPIEHYIRREGDQLSCHKCGKAWDVKDLDPPPCITKRDSDLKHIGELRSKLEVQKPAPRYEDARPSYIAQSLAAALEVQRRTLETLEAEEENFFNSRLKSLGLDRIKEAHRRPQRVSLHQHLTALDNGHWKELRVYGEVVAITRTEVVQDSITLIKENVKFLDPPPPQTLRGH